MPWVGDAAYGGFSTAAPWLPMPDAHRDLAVDVQERDEGGLLHEWRRFLSFRRAHPALVRGGLVLLDLPEPLVGFFRQDAHERVLCLFNLSPGAVDVPALDIEAPATLPPYGTAFLAI
jgi:alpha-glucosidase